MADEDDRRREARAPIELKVEYKRLNTFFYDYTKNISKGGTFIKTEKPLDIGTIFLFKLMLPAQPEPLALRGEVRWVVKEGAAAAAAGRRRATSPAWASSSSTTTPTSAISWSDRRADDGRQPGPAHLLAPGQEAEARQ